MLTRRADAAPSLARDFALANLGRQFWRQDDGRDYWLSVGRNNTDNKRLAAAAGPDDALLSLTGLPGPLGLARHGATWPRPLLEEAAALTDSYAPKAVAVGGLTALRASWKNGGMELTVPPQRAGTPLVRAFMGRGAGRNPGRSAPQAGKPPRAAPWGLNRAGGARGHDLPSLKTTALYKRAFCSYTFLLQPKRSLYAEPISRMRYNPAGGYMDHKDLEFFLQTPVRHAGGSPTEGRQHHRGVDRQQ